MNSRGRWARLLALTVALVALIAAAAVATASAGAGQLAFRELTSGSRGANLPGERTQDVGQVLRSASQATRRLRAWGLDTAAVRSVDFDRESLIAVLADYQPNGGYRARVSRVVVRGGEAIVTADVSDETADGEFTVSDLERPWVVVAVDRRAVARVRDDVRIRRR
jgi:hypothetical protein